MQETLSKGTYGNMNIISFNLIHSFNISIVKGAN